MGVGDWVRLHGSLMVGLSKRDITGLLIVVGGLGQTYLF